MYDNNIQQSILQWGTTDITNFLPHQPMYKVKPELPRQQVREMREVIL